MEWHILVPQTHYQTAGGGSELTVPGNEALSEALLCSVTPLVNREQQQHLPHRVLQAWVVVHIA